MVPLAPRFTEVARRIRQPTSPQQTILANGGRAPQVQSVSKMNFSNALLLSIAQFSKNSSVSSFAAVSYTCASAGATH